MKPLTDTILRVRVKGLDISEVQSCDFVFRQSLSRNSKQFALRNYPQNVSYSAEDDCFLIPFTPSETDKFPPNATVYIDIRPIVSGKAIPVSLVKTSAYNTLFNRSDVDVD